jgi:acyl-CoA synthetase (AMP-forming)/AMP-acid ligase II
MVGALAAGLLAQGVAPGSRIGFLAPRGPLGVIGFLAASCVGTCCPLNPRLTANESAAALDNLSIAALLDGAGQGEAAGLAVPRFGVALDGEQVRLDGAVLSASLPPIDPGAAALLMQTSGTTSRPKLVALTHDNVLAAAAAIGGAFGLGPGDLCLNPMPLHHVHGLISAAIASLRAGSAVHCADGFSPAGFDALSRALSPTWFTASPAMHLASREYHEEAGTTPPLGLRFFRSSSAPLPASAIAALERLFRAPLIETYGLTETASMVCSNLLPPAMRKPGSVGVACGAEIAIVDAAGRRCTPDEDGEIAIRGPSTITAYANGEAADSFRDGWLLTGDLGRMDADGYLYVVGRVKELIKRGGLSVYPAEIDDALAAHPAVAEATSFAVPHSTLGEDVAAAVVLRAGADISEAALRAHVAAALSTYKVPSVILAVSAIPKNETGKIIRRQVAAAFADRLAPKGQKPADTVERALLSVWRAVLDRDDIGVTDNVFLFGADPLRAERAARRIASDGWAPTVKDLLAAPTVAEQAALARREITRDPATHPAVKD